MCGIGYVLLQSDRNFAKLSPLFNLQSQEVLLHEERRSKGRTNRVSDPAMSDPALTISELPDTQPQSAQRPMTQQRPNYVSVPPVTPDSGTHSSTPTRSSQIRPIVDILSPTAPVDSRPDALECYTITLGAGFRFQYLEADLSEPNSLVGLISDPDELYSLWDDTSASWRHRSPLLVRGVPVAIKYWKAFYGNFKQQKVWDAIKQNWHNFRVIMHLSRFNP